MKIDYWGELKQNIQRGIDGLNKGLPTGFERLNQHISNIQQKRYTTIGGATGTGKTAYVDSAYLFHPYEFLKANPDYHHSLEVIYYSLEIPPEEKLAKFVCFKLWEQYGINIDSKVLYSEGDFKIPPEVIPLIDKMEEYFAKMQEKVLTFRSSMSPNYMYKDVMSYAEKRGVVERNKDGVVINYTPHDPNLITEIIIDHANLITPNAEDKGNQKAAIDRASKMLVFFRNMFKFSPIVVSQFNRGIEGMDRKQMDSQEPQLSDFKETGATQEDANVVIGLFNPFRYGMKVHRGYPVSEIKRRYRSAHVLKNRGGADGLVVGLHFLGEIGKFKELPKADVIKDDPALLQKILDYGKR
ncbi:MAG: DnaB-like helicase C-terminal domain-containing protein [Promethearchaeota archaeon]|jgi:replicative DNA helicase